MDIKSRLRLYQKPIAQQKQSTLVQKTTDDLEVIEELITKHPESPISLLSPATLTFKPGFERASHKVLFLDVECLSLGTGPANIPWLIGTASFTSQGLNLKLLLCHSPPAETESLSFLDDIWGNYDTIITYNGASFDIPLLKSRYALYRRMFPSKELAHHDLYHILRRVYPTKPQRLVDAESRILGFERKDDLPGSYSGQAYFEYLRYGKTELLHQIMRHNKADVATLAALALRLNEAVLQTQEGQTVWAPKMHKLKQAKPDFILKAVEARSYPDGEDWRFAAEAHLRLKNEHKALRFYLKAARLHDSRAYYPAVQLLKKLKKKKLALTLIDYFLYRSEANIQEKLLATRRVLLKTGKSNMSIKK